MPCVISPRHASPVTNPSHEGGRMPNSSQCSKMGEGDSLEMYDVKDEMPSVTSPSQGSAKMRNDEMQNVSDEMLDAIPQVNSLRHDSLDMQSVRDDMPGMPSRSHGSAKMIEDVKG